MKPLGELPAQDLRYRLVTKLNLLQPEAPRAATSTHSSAELDRRRSTTPLDRGHDGPRR